MFEALRGLRDAVAPESGNLGNPGNNSNNENSEPDFEEFWQNYRNGDPDTIAMVKKVTEKHPHKREDFIRIHAKVEREKDAELVQKLANTVLEKSADIDESVSSLPGMHRTRAQQMEYIEELMNKNRETAEKLEEAFNDAQQRRDLVRKFVRDNTCAALGIIEDAG
jgi:Mg2+ and Co2+ transporter CorA